MIIVSVTLPCRWTKRIIYKVKYLATIKPIIGLDFSKAIAIKKRKKLRSMK